ncbi:MAG: FKBP-type peptidyl-prolyl cis-trans isomerase [Trueperaceae bacterium]
MSIAKAGDTVKIHYTGTLDSGEQFDSSVGGEPLEFTLGGGQVIVGFDEGVSGMTLGEKKTVRMLPKDAYGEYDDALVIQVPRAELPTLNYELGTELVMQQPSGRSIPVVVIDATNETIVLDANHPLAGEALTFNLELVGIR